MSEASAQKIFRKNLGLYTIALPIPSFLPAFGGAEVGLHNIALSFVKKGYRPIVITSFRHAKALKKKGWNLPYEIIAYPPRLLTWYRVCPALGPFLLKLFHGWLQRKYNFYVWHATFGYPVGTAVIEFCAPLGLPHIVRCVGEDIQINTDISYGMRLDPKVDKTVRKVLPRAERLIATTNTVRKEYISLGIDAARIVQLPNGVELKRLKSHSLSNDLKKKLGLDAKTFLFLAVGRYHIKKNFEQLIKVSEKLTLNAKGPFAIAICGIGISGLQTLIEEYKAEGIVYLNEASNETNDNGEIMVPSDEVLDWYYSADCFLMPSIVESFGIVTVEAMACGLPVIVADSPGSRDVIRNGQDGLLYDGSDVGLVNSMFHLMNSKQQQARLKKLSLARASDFDWMNIIDSYIESYATMRLSLNLKKKN